MTTHEQEVLDLLARHLTNVQIADTLSIPVRTVESHVSSLLRKLQLTDRRSLARAAAAAGTHVRRPLPHAATSFVGREAERRALVDAIGRHRMVTALGPGGVGKTRLVLRVAAEIAGRFPDGVVFVDLVHVNDPSMVAAAIAEACDVPERHGTSLETALTASLSRRAVLLVVDNCEHLLDGVRDCLDAILAGCPDARVLATGQARLLTPYEHVYAVPGMSSSDGVALFTARAVAAGAQFVDASRVAVLCRALDGMALAIEVAAARCSSLGLDGLEAGLDQRLRFLTAGGPVADRHRSLRNAIVWSYDLLADDDRALLRTVSVFACWFDTGAAAALTRRDTGTSPTASRGWPSRACLLVDRGDPTRYRALETIRQFGVEQLAAADALEDVRARHLRWCRLVLARARPGRRAGDRRRAGARRSMPWSTTSGQRSCSPSPMTCAPVPPPTSPRRSPTRCTSAVARPKPSAASSRPRRRRPTRPVVRRCCASPPAPRAAGTSGWRRWRCSRRPPTWRSCAASTAPPPLTWRSCRCSCRGARR